MTSAIIPATWTTNELYGSIITNMIPATRIVYIKNASQLMFEPKYTAKQIRL